MGLKYNFGYIVPLATIGPHITINPKNAIINKKINFKVKKIYQTKSYNMCKLAAFCPKNFKYYVLRWFLLEVSIPNNLKPLKGLPHITLASYVAVNK